MSHVQIRQHPDAGGAPGAYQLIVDGVDMSLNVMSEGFAVAFGDGAFVPATVQMVVAADALDIDLPDAVIKALRADEVA